MSFSYGKIDLTPKVIYLWNNNSDTKGKIYLWNNNSYTKGNLFMEVQV